MVTRMGVGGIGMGGFPIVNVLRAFVFSAVDYAAFHKNNAFLSSDSVPVILLRYAQRAILVIFSQRALPRTIQPAYNHSHKAFQTTKNISIFPHAFPVLCRITREPYISINVANASSKVTRSNPIIP